jgi:hypothetical protein
MTLTIMLVSLVFISLSETMQLRRGRQAWQPSPGLQLVYRLTLLPPLFFTTSPLADDSEVEVYGSPILSPTNTCILHLKRLMKPNHGNVHLAKCSRYVSPQQFSSYADDPSPNWLDMQLAPSLAGYQSSIPFSPVVASSSKDNNAQSHASSHTSGIITHPSSSSSTDESEVEVVGSPALSPTNICMSHLAHIASRELSNSHLAGHSRHVSPMHFTPPVESSLRVPNLLGIRSMHCVLYSQILF